MTNATDKPTDAKAGDELTLSEVRTIALFATGMAESLLDVADQKGVDIDSMTMEINGDGEEIPVKKLLALFKHKLGMNGTSTANAKED